MSRYETARWRCLVVAGALILLPASLFAKEFPIGEGVITQGMSIKAVYLQPIEMDPPGLMRAAKDSDVHLEIDIKAEKDNKNGFALGDWLPYLTVHYELAKAGEAPQKGLLMPMVANDGPHYGDNVKLSGVGSYKLKITIDPPSADDHAHFGRHVDKETGVDPWFSPITAEFDFSYAGTGKKGGY